MQWRTWQACLAALAVALSVSSHASGMMLSSAADLTAAVAPAGLQLPGRSALATQQEQQHATANQQLLPVDRPLIAAHRGASGLLPEHTVPAYLAGIQEGADFIECDVVVTRDLQLICRHEPNLNDTTDAWERFRDRATSYVINGVVMSGVFASDLTLAEVQQLRAVQRWPFRDHSFDGQFGVVTLEDFIDLALTAARPVGIYPEAKHPTWHNQLPALKGARTTIEELMVKTLHSKGYATSATYGSAAWRARPVLIQSFESTSLRRFAALTPVPLALLLDKNAAPDTGAPLSETLSEGNLAQLSSFVTVIAPWKAMFYTISGQRQRPGTGLALPGVPAGALVSNTGSSQHSAHAAAGGGSNVNTEAGFTHPDVPLSSSPSRELQESQHLQSTGLAALLHKHGFLVHTYTLRDEGQFVLPTCMQHISCEFEWLFGHEGLDGAFADWPGTLVQWVQQHHHKP